MRPTATAPLLAEKLTPLFLIPFYSHPPDNMHLFANLLCALAATEKYPFRNAPLASPPPAPATKFGSIVREGMDERHPRLEEPCYKRINYLHEKQRELAEWKQVHIARVDIEKRSLTPDPWVGIWHYWEKDAASW